MKTNEYHNLATVEENAEVAKPNALQILYIAYASIYMLLCLNLLHNFGIVLHDGAFWAMSAGALIFTVAVLVYNRRRETWAANKIICRLFVMVAIFAFCYRGIALF